MKESITIHNAVFTYKDKEDRKEKPVLEIPNLNLKKGEITFIVGVSGSGKSTVLETLGLMNDTFPCNHQTGMSIEYRLENHECVNANKKRDIVNPSIWADLTKTTCSKCRIKVEDEDGYQYDKSYDYALEREKLRKENLSFIFQNTNLMPNFSAIENVCITDMVNDKNYQESYLKTLLLFQKLGLGDLDIDSKPTKISGGQRQRVAFARALISDYNILFGDEPTGNLDRKTANEVMSILYDLIKKTDGEEDKSTIIVSHDLDLAAKYADRIVVISKVNGAGKIQTENIYNCKNIENKKSEHNFKKTINDFFEEIESAEQFMSELWSDLHRILESDNEKTDNCNFTVNDYLNALFIALTGDTGVLKLNSLINRGKISKLEDLHSKKVTEFKQRNLGDKQYIFGPRFCEFLGKLLGPKRSREKELSKNLRWKREYLNDSETFNDQGIIKHVEDLLEKKSKEIKQPNTGQNDNDKDDKDDGEQTMDSKKFRENFNKKITDIYYWFRKLLFKIFLFGTKLFSNKVNDYKYTDLFFSLEGKELIGYFKRLKTFLTASALIIITFLAIGFGNGSLIYLGEKMNDPFVKFMTIVVKMKKQPEVVSKLITPLNNSPEKRQKYGINQMYGFAISSLDFVAKNGSVIEDAPGRTMDVEDPILKELLNSYYFIGNKNGFRNPTDCGIIISKDFMHELGLDKNDKFLQIKLEGDNEAVIALPIVTVFERIPEDVRNKFSFIITDYMFSNLIDPINPTKTPFSPKNTNSLILYLDSQNEKEAEDMLSGLKKYISECDNNRVELKGQTFKLMNKEELHVYETDTIAYTPGYYAVVGFQGRKPNYQQVKQLYNEIVKERNLSDMSITMLPQPNLFSYSEMAKRRDRIDRLVIYFNNLNHINAFEDEVIEPEFDYLNLTMDKIISLNNYKAVTKLTLILSAFLIIISVITIANFLSNVFENHLSKIKMNIGTLMAFGTGGLKSVYRALMMSFLSLSIILSIALASGIGYLIMDPIIGVILDDPKGWYFDLWCWGSQSRSIPFVVTIVTILSIYVWTIHKYRKVINKILATTPGNLINDREQS
ncbi:MAG: ABC transporter ATP-binding protein [Bacteroidales bacterium]|nr:ABC transporter ATP-binding protein [Bacteroidales bacterium]MCF8345541.1 ABC transporter ATP-binding protein [Bacteroidales bacterium]MCF8351001.1 ABC transporter ATP-binding protein [Bacteroidales bacterium]MCF8376125.1 ABC transporter ATP-binding protein [Bacteroidales bacterium]